MPNLAGLFIYGTDELVDRHWAEVSSQMEAVEGMNPELDRIMMSMAEHCFRAGWATCLKAIVEAEQRKDGQA